MTPNYQEQEHATLTGRNYIILGMGITLTSMDSSFNHSHSFL